MPTGPTDQYNCNYQEYDYEYHSYLFGAHVWTNTCLVQDFAAGSAIANEYVRSRLPWYFYDFARIQAATVADLDYACSHPRARIQVWLGYIYLRCP
ncbi:hypothetical protein Vau01_095310 [Virgisporangium aurantiacum]|uniref:Uncharacterized protein n=1 Tax=Virgisporangium aurantiacum TaxID=175570 RepID=A0A8J3ZI83_9ACTN|nr:hypothetical protein Vau01_095310 [Virgisporangium aurantiacum]